MTLLSRLRNENCLNFNDSLSLYGMYDHLKYDRYTYTDFEDTYGVEGVDLYESIKDAYTTVKRLIRSDISVNAERHCPSRAFSLERHFSSLYTAIAEHYIECNDCGDTSCQNDSIYVAGYDNYVGSCCSDNYRYHESHDEYYHDDDYPYDDDEDYDDDGYHNGVYGYDYDVTEQLSPIYHGNEKRLLATEIEVERRNDCSSNIAEMVSTTMNNFALCKHDGSLNNGFEIVTAPATISALKEGWTKFCEANYSDQLSSWHTGTCGMHIHVDRTSLTPLEIGKLLVFVNGKANSKFMEAIAGRDSRQWSAKKYKGIKDALQRSDKYEALATHKPKTIEFRVFRGNIAKQGIMRNIEFVDALCNFVRTVGMDKDTDTVNRLSYTNFVSYMNTSENKGSYPYLFSWLVRKGYNKGRTKNIQNESEES